MTEILQNQVLETEHLLCFRGEVTNAELESIGQDMESVIKNAGGRRVGFPITATYGMNNGKMDIELLIPVDRCMDDIKKYGYKKQLKIVNAVVASYKGHPRGLQEACNQLNQHIIDHGLQPITVGYNVTKKTDMLNPENTEIDVYVGITPNIL